MARGRVASWQTSGHGSWRSAVAAAGGSVAGRLRLVLVTCRCTFGGGFPRQVAGNCGPGPEPNKERPRRLATGHMSLDVTGCHWMSLDVTGCCWHRRDGREPTQNLPAAQEPRAPPLGLSCRQFCCFATQTPTLKNEAKEREIGKKATRMANGWTKGCLKKRTRSIETT